MVVPDFTPSRIEEFAFEVMDRLTREAVPHALSVIPSEQLKAKLQPRVLTHTTGDLFITSYWALFVHDGHGEIRPSRARFLVYYVNRDDDPRRPGGQAPDRAADERRLTRSEFAFGIAENRRRQQTNPSGGPNQFMIVVRNDDGTPGTTGPAAGVPFFETLMEPFEREAEDLLYDLLEEFVLSELDDMDFPPIVFTI